MISAAEFASELLRQMATEVQLCDLRVNYLSNDCSKGVQLINKNAFSTAIVMLESLAAKHGIELGTGADGDNHKGEQ